MPMRTRLTCLLSMLALHAAGARAATYCVSTPDEFRAALNAIAQEDDGNDADLAQEQEIRVRQGSYLFDSGNLLLFKPLPGSLTIRGGYGIGCNAAGPDPNATVFDGGATTELAIRTPGDVTIEGIRFTRWQDDQIGGYNAAIGIEVTRPGTVLRIANNVFDHNLGFSTLTLADAKGSIELVNNLLHNNTGAQACTVNVESVATSTYVYAVHNTAAFNSDPVCFNVRTPHLTIANNIFWRESTPENPGISALMLASLAQPALAHDNLISGLIVPGNGIVTLARNLNANPQFVDAANGDFRLESDSPAVNRGAPGVPGGLPELDLVGQQRRIGAFPDLGALESAQAHPFDYLVTNTGDGGSGSLRHAIALANAAGAPARIVFSLAGGCGPHTIALQTALPAPTVPLLIDGYTQPGSLPNSRQAGAFDATLCVQLTPASAAVNRAFDLPSDTLTPVEIRGLVFGGFGFAAVRILGGAGHALTGNQFGGIYDAAGGTEITGLGTGALIGGSSRGTVLGGPHPAQRNWFAAGSIAAVTLTATDSFGHVLGNTIGERGNAGNGARTSGAGARVLGSGWRITDNQIAGVGGDGVLLLGTSATGNLIARNRIGVGPAGNDYGNVGAGVRVSEGASGNAIGGDSPGNAIAHNETNVWIESGEGNRVVGNTMYHVGGVLPSQNLDLGVLGPDANDPGDGDTGPGNRGQNVPVPVAIAIDTAGEITLDAILEGDTEVFDIEVVQNFACGSGEPPSVSMSHRIFKDVVSKAPAPGEARQVRLFLGEFSQYPEFVSLIATDADGNTSEISPCFALPQQTTLLADGFEADGSGGDDSK